jgi:hypothetical protein
MHMNTDTENPNPSDVFADPVAYLARFGIVAEIVSDTSLPVAA